MSRISHVIPLSAIEKSTKFRSVQVRVMSVWVQKGMSGKESLEMYLMDREETMIPFSVPNGWLKKLKPQFNEGQVVKISNFTVENNSQLNGKSPMIKHDLKLYVGSLTKVEQLPLSPGFPENVFSFVPFTEFLPDPNCKKGLPKNIDPRYVFDVIGIVNMPLKALEYVDAAKARKLDVTLLDDTSSLQCILWESFADQLKKFVDERGQDEKDPVVIILQFACLSTYKTVHRAQTQKNGSKMYINLDCMDVKALINRRESAGSSAAWSLTTQNTTSNPDRWLKSSMIRTLTQLDSCTEVGVYLTRAMTWTIDPKSTWNYAGCGNEDCTKGVPRYWVIGDVCSKCNNRVESIVPRFKVRIQVVDQSDSAVYFTLFDKSVSSILQKSAAEVLSDNQLEIGVTGSVPDEIDALCGREFLFRVEVDQKSIDEKDEKKKSFAVKELTDDSNILDQFMDLDNSNEVGSMLKLDDKDVSIPTEKNILVSQSGMESMEDSDSTSTNCEVTPETSKSVAKTITISYQDEFQLSVVSKKIKLEK
ncbi:hypothetical protein OROHE_008071 [Orobanche hederae]